MRLGNRTIGVNLVKNVSAFDTPFAPLGLLLFGSMRTIYLSPLWGLLLFGSMRTIHHRRQFSDYHDPGCGTERDNEG